MKRLLICLVLLVVLVLQPLSYAEENESQVLTDVLNAYSELDAELSKLNQQKESLGLRNALSVYTEYMYASGHPGSPLVPESLLATPPTVYDGLEDGSEGTRVEWPLIDGELTYTISSIGELLKWNLAHKLVTVKSEPEDHFETARALLEALHYAPKGDVASELTAKLIPTGKHTAISSIELYRTYGNVVESTPSRYLIYRTHVKDGIYTYEAEIPGIE